jgi:hypothetical protein
VCAIGKRTSQRVHEMQRGQMPAVIGIWANIRYAHAAMGHRKAGTMCPPMPRIRALRNEARLVSCHGDMTPGKPDN